MFLKLLDRFKFLYPRGLINEWFKQGLAIFSDFSLMNEIIHNILQTDITETINVINTYLWLISIWENKKLDDFITEVKYFVFLYQNISQVQPSRYCCVKFIWKTFPNLWLLNMDTGGLLHEKGLFRHACPFSPVQSNGGIKCLSDWLTVCLFQKNKYCLKVINIVCHN